MARRAVVSIASLALFLTTAFACQSVPPAHDLGGGQPTEQATEREQAQVIERLLALTVAGQTLGTIDVRLEKAADGTWTSREAVSFSVTREGGGPDAQFSSTSESVTVYDAAHEFVSSSSVEREADVTITRTLTREGDELISTYAGPGQPEQTKRFTVPDDYRSSLAVDIELVQAWTETNQPATRRYSNFDAERERFEPTEVTILGAVDYRHGDETIPAYRFRTVEEDGTVIESIVDHDLTPLEVNASGTFIAKLVDSRPTLDGGGGRINSELPVSGRTTANWLSLAEQRVTVTVEGDDPEAPPLWESNHYHRVERDGPRYAMTLLSTRPAKDFAAPTLPMAIDDAEVRRFLEPTPMAQSDNQAIITEAKRIVGGESNGLRAAQKIVSAVFANIDKQAGVRGSATATEVLQNGAGDCTEHAVLVVALMRAAGIPARVVDGIVFASGPDGSGMAGYHAWAEIWLGRWIGVDATVDETGTSARYFQFGVDEPGTIGSGGKMMRSIGRTKIELGPHLTYEERDR